jgi:hypothetical protein
MTLRNFRGNQAALFELTGVAIREFIRRGYRHPLTAARSQDGVGLAGGVRRAGFVEAVVMAGGES